MEVKQTETKEIKTEKKERTGEKQEKREEKIESSLIRIAGTDIPGTLTVYAGLTKIRGVSWALSNAICKSLGIEKTKKVSNLSDVEIEKITKFLKNPNLPSWLLNRRKDIETGEDRHLITTELDLAREFDIRRMKKIKSYKGIRHTLGQPVRGQRTKAHFRKGKAIGVSRSKTKPASSAKQ